MNRAESERDMTLWWTANLLGAQRGIADWLNANAPPARREQWQWCICMRVSAASLCLWVCVFAWVGRRLHKCLVRFWVWLIMLTCRQQCSKHKVPHIPHISDVSTVISLLIPRREGQGTFPSQIKLRLLKPFCCQITSLNNSLAPLFSVHFMEGILSFASHFWLSPVLFFHRFISYPNKSQDCEAHD